MRESTKENIFLFSSFVLICIIGIIYYFVDLNNNAIKSQQPPPKGRGLVKEQLSY